jgi:hypothetical protein
MEPIKRISSGIALVLEPFCHPSRERGQGLPIRRETWQE